MVRHTKKQQLVGEEVLQLPGKHEETVPGACQAWLCVGALQSGVVVREQ